MANTFNERFGYGMNMAVGVQAEAMQNITEVFVVGVRVEQTGAEPERNIIVDLVVDGEAYELGLKFRDETFNERTLAGREKHRVNW